MTSESVATYEILVQGKTGPVGCVHRCWVVADHLGAAIEAACEVAKSNEIEDAVACEAFPATGAPDDAVEVADSVFCQPDIQTFPLDPNDDPLQYPVGIIPGDNPPECDPDDIAEAYAIDSETKPFDVELVVDRRRIRTTYLDLITWLPSASALEIRICGHWDDTHRTGTWLSPDWNSHETIARYITDHERDLFLNGFVELGIYSRKEKSTLRLDDHKTIRFYTEDTTNLDECARRIQDLGFIEVDSLRTIARGFYHYHYRPVLSLDRVRLIETLEADGFRHVDSIHDENYSARPDERS